MMSSVGENPFTDSPSGPSSFQVHYAQYTQILSHYLDKSTIYPNSRWFCFLFFFVLFCIRVYTVGGYYIVAYGLGLHLLSLFIGFISPQDDPEDEDYILPTKREENDEYKPFIRRLPEFKFWLSSIKATSISLVLTAFPIFNLAVFWPLLVFYFILLVILTMRQQIAKMIKYKYVPFSWGKERYGDITHSDPNAPSSGLQLSGWDIFGTSNSADKQPSSSSSTNPYQHNNNSASYTSYSNINLHQPGNNIKMTHPQPNPYITDIPLPPTVQPPPRHFPTTTLNPTSHPIPSVSWPTSLSASKASKSH